jgi:H/ACA ribonucleoprotein complex non-core subunit NAF1
MDIAEIAKLVASDVSPQSEMTGPARTAVESTPFSEQIAQQHRPVPMKAVLEQRIAAMRAEIKEKERVAALNGPAQVSAVTGSVASAEDSPASSVNFSILDKALATHGFEAMPDSEEDSDISSESEDSSSSDSDDEDAEKRHPLTAEERERILIAADGEGESSSTIPPRTKHELAEDEEPVVQPTEQVLPTDEIRLLGQVSSMVDRTCVIAGTIQASSDTTQTLQSVLDVGSLLVLADRRNVGYIADTFGPVAAPLFAVRFQEPEHATQLGLMQGDDIYMVPRYARYVFGDTLRVKGSDASNIHDEEVGGDEVEFSDDEQEAAYKKMLKEMRKSNKGHATEARQRPISDLEAIAEQQGFNAPQQRPVRGGRGGARGGRSRGGAAQQPARDAPRQPYQRAFYTPDTVATPQPYESTAPAPFQGYAPLKRPDA